LINLKPFFISCRNSAISSGFDFDSLILKAHFRFYANCRLDFYVFWFFIDIVHNLNIFNKRYGIILYITDPASLNQWSTDATSTC
jgi:hypothetical protein